VIPVDTQFREASTRRVPLPLFIPRSRGSVAYGALLDQLLGVKQTDDSMMVAS
jgi:chromosome partitioning protein